MPAVQLVTLKKRQDFLRIRGGRRCQNVAFIIEAKPRPPQARDIDAQHTLPTPPAAADPRFGFTITKKIGNAVVRNRIRRRLKHAISEIAAEFAKPEHDYVVIARRRAATQPYGVLKKDLERCLQRVHDPRSKQRRQ